MISDVALKCEKNGALPTIIFKERSKYFKKINTAIDHRKKRCEFYHDPLRA